jgi:hypothetical protein
VDVSQKAIVVEARLSLKWPASFKVQFYESHPYVSCVSYICFEARQVYLNTFKPLLGKQKGFPTIYANLKVGTIHFGQNFEIRQLEAFATTIDKSQVRRLVLGYHYRKVVSLAYAGRRVFQICALFQQLKTLTFVPHGETSTTGIFPVGSGKLNTNPRPRRILSCGS